MIQVQLPWRTRAKLAFQFRIDAIADWLINHRMLPLAIGLWKIFRMI